MAFGSASAVSKPPHWMLLNADCQSAIRQSPTLRYPGDHFPWPTCRPIITRVFLEPFRGALIRTAPGEVNHTNSISRRGLAGTMEEAQERLKNLKVEP